MEIAIRHAQPGDLETLAELLRELFSLEADFVVDEMRQRRGLKLLLDGCGKHRCLLVAEHKGQVIGLCSAQIVISTAEGGPAALVEDVVVAARWRRQGVGCSLLAHIEDWAHRRGATRMQLLADRTNDRALAFYAGIGWRSTQLVCLRKGVHHGRE
ncbi:MAG: GNAT family N-acetyltransferase [Desulfosarcinaceae bacterium]